MADLETSLARSDRGVTPAQRVVASGDTDKPNVMLTIGKGSGNGSGVKTISASFSYSQTSYMDKQEKSPRLEAVPLPPPAPPLPGQPKDRREHIKRIPGESKNAAGQWVPEPGAWLDMRRVDKYSGKEGSGVNYQKAFQTIRWYEDAEGNEINKDWKTSKLYILPPDEDPDNPQLRFPVDVVEEFTIKDDDQKIKRKLVNDDTNRRRKVTPRRVTHFDTPADDDPELENGGLIRDYKRIAGTEDREQNIDYEIIGKFTRIDNDQRTTVSLDNGYLVNRTRAVEKDYGGRVNPPWRLDPLQNIENVNLGMDNFVVLVSFASGIVYWTDDCENFHKVAGYPFFEMKDPLGSYVSDVPLLTDRGEIQSITFDRANKLFLLCGTSHIYNLIDGDIPHTDPEFRAKMAGSRTGKTFFNIDIPYRFNHASSAGAVRYDKKNKRATANVLDTTVSGGVIRPIYAENGTTWQNGFGTVVTPNDAPTYFGVLKGGGCQLRLRTAPTNIGYFGGRRPYSIGALEDNDPGIKLERSTDGNVWSVIDIGWTITSAPVFANGVYLIAGRRASTDESAILSSEDGLDFEIAFQDTDDTGFGFSNNVIWSSLASGRVAKP